MTIAALPEVLQRCGLGQVALSSDGLPSLGHGEEFKKTFDKVSLVLGGTHDSGEGQLHFTNLCVSTLCQRCTATELCGIYLLACRTD
jgi:hypothetical protein